MAGLWLTRWEGWGGWEMSLEASVRIPILYCRREKPLSSFELST